MYTVLDASPHSHIHTHRTHTDTLTHTARRPGKMLLYTILVIIVIVVTIGSSGVDAGGADFNPVRFACSLYHDSCPANAIYKGDTYPAGNCLRLYQGSQSGPNANDPSAVTSFDQCGTACCKGRMCAGYTCTGGYTPKSNRECVYDTTLTLGVCTRSHCCNAPPACSLGACSATLCGTQGTRSATNTPVGTANF
jgi:hypothetical protein